MAARLTQAFNSIKPRIPLIKFRKGMPSTPSVEAQVNTTPAAAQTVVQATPSPASSQQTSKLKANVESHEWWDTPFKFKRRQLDQSEIDFINSGGSDKLFC